jgi:hypothetical protein
MKIVLGLFTSVLQDCIQIARTCVIALNIFLDCLKIDVVHSGHRYQSSRLLVNCLKIRYKYSCSPVDYLKKGILTKSIGNPDNRIVQECKRF